MVADRDAAAAGRVVAEITAAGGTAAAFTTDVRSYDQTQALAQFVVDSYGALDFALNNAGITPALVDEYAQRGVRINAVASGPIDAPSARTSTRDPRLHRRQDRHGWVGEVGEVANTVSFVLSDEAAFITGSVYEVNGGQTQL